jgi:hypothetical protein
MPRILNLEDLVKSFEPVFKAAGLPAPSILDFMNQLVAQEAAEVNTLNARMQGLAGNPYREQKCLYDEKGNSFGYVRAEIPEEILFKLMAPVRHGGKGLTAPEAEAEALKMYPQCRVKTLVKPRFHGFSFKRSRRTYASFGRGTLQFAV